jgi:NADPH2:quinone reductase
MARAAQFSKTGGPEVIDWIDCDLPQPGPGEVRFRSTAVGLNYIDTYFRSGLYPSALPSGLGVEAAGVVTAVGENAGFAVGDRAATFGPKTGAYATERNLPGASLFRVPDAIDDATAAAVLLKGCTTEFLIERCARVQPGWDVLVHAAAGGVGLLLVQWLKHIGARVIGTVSTPEKAAAARAAGADEIIVYTHEPVAPRVRALTGGNGVQVVFDGVGMTTWEASLGSTARRGLIVSFGNAGGPVRGVDLAMLAANGSLFCSRPSLFDYYTLEVERAAGSARVWDMVCKGIIKVMIGQTYALEDAEAAHRDLEGGRTTGSTVLTV